jgi:hypothetical protein
LSPICQQVKYFLFSLPQQSLNSKPFNPKPQVCGMAAGDVCGMAAGDVSAGAGERMLTKAGVC